MDIQCADMVLGEHAIFFPHGVFIHDLGGAHPTMLSPAFLVCKNLSDERTELRREFESCGPRDIHLPAGGLNSQGA